jgi:biofilm PGA synthesis lipoprotein PgaB
MEQAKNPHRWLLKLAARVAASNGLDRTVFELQTVNWNAPERPIPTEEIARQMHLLEGAGVRNLAYYPDDFLKDHPTLKVLRLDFSTSEYLPLRVEGAR